MCTGDSKINTIFLTISYILMIRPTLNMLTTHFKCRGGLYPRSNIERFVVPDEKVCWSTDFKEYDPPYFTSPSLHGKPYADPEIGETNFMPKWHHLDGNISRESYMGQYKIHNGYPLNPIGRTGLKGRGVLGRWGPNHAADPVVTRWKRLENGEIAVDQTKKPVLQFIGIKRGDTGEWALPGGMVDPGEKVSATAIREFQEEALNSFVLPEGERKTYEEKFNQFFSGGEIIYQGYIDDRRNTDNAWMESIAYNFHDETGTTVGALKLLAGDDAVGVRWIDVTPDLKLYASHKEILDEVLKQRLQLYYGSKDNK